MVWAMFTTASIGLTISLNWGERTSRIKLIHQAAVICTLTFFLLLLDYLTEATLSDFLVVVYGVVILPPLFSLFVGIRSR